jgi:hypothetical protein
VKADLSHRALAIARDAVDATDGAELVEASAHFTRPESTRRAGSALRFDIVVEGTAGGDDGAIEAGIRAAVSRLVQDRTDGVVSFVRVSVVPGPGGQPN